MHKNLFMRLANLVNGAILQVGGRVVQYKNNDYCLYKNGSFIGKTGLITVAYDFIKGGKYAEC